MGCYQVHSYRFNEGKKMNKHLVTKDSTQKMARGIVSKLTNTKGEVISKKNIYKFKMSAVYGKIENDMLVDILLASNDFVTRVERVH